MAKQPWGPRPIPAGVPGLEPHDCVYRRRCEELEHQLVILELELRVLKNPDLKQVATTLVELAKEVDEQSRRGCVDERGYVEIEAWKVAKRAGVDRATVRRHMQAGVERGLVQKEVARTRLGKPAVNRATGEMRDFDSHVLVRSQAGLVDRLIELGSYKAETEHKPTWGGARVRCPEHPNAPVIKHTNYQCSECHRIVRAEREVLDDTEKKAGKRREKPA